MAKPAKPDLDQSLTVAKAVPAGNAWAHEVKHDG